MSAVEDLLLSDPERIAAAAASQPLDAVVIGGGPSGITAAHTLGDAGRRVALLEAGPLALLEHASSTDLRFTSGAVRVLQETLSYGPRAAAGGDFGALVACLGGRGMFWNGAAPRFLASDVAAWPLERAELDSFYDWAEGELFVSRNWGTTPVASASARLLRRAGFAVDPEPFAIDSMRSVDGWLSGTIGNPVSSLLRSNLLAGPPDQRRLLVSTNAFALRVDRPSGSELVEVAVRDQRTGATHTVATRSVVLAAGGFESVRLALSSQLPDASGTLGRRLSDHWFVRAYFPLPPSYYDPRKPEAGAVLIRPTPQQQFQIELHLPARRFFQAHASSGWKPAATEEYAAMVRAFAPTRSQDSSYIELTDGDGPGGYTVHMETTAADEQLTGEMRAGLERVRDALGAADAEIETYPLGSSYHEAGGLQMGSDASAGVVDPHGRFWGEPRVWAVDASTWPAIGCTNPHLTLVTMARRQSQRLAQELAANR